MTPSLLIFSLLFFFFFCLPSVRSSLLSFLFPSLSFVFYGRGEEEENQWWPREERRMCVCVCDRGERRKTSGGRDKVGMKGKASRRRVGIGEERKRGRDRGTGEREREYTIFFFYYSPNLNNYF